MGSESTLSPTFFAAGAIIVAVYAAQYVTRLWLFARRISQFPTPQEGSKRNAFVSSQQDRIAWLTNAHRLIQSGFSKATNAIRITTDLGPVIVLSPHLAGAIKADERLSPGKYTERELFGDVPGLEPFKFASTHRQLMRDVIVKRLNKSLDQAVNYLSVEATNALETRWSNQADFHEISLSQSVLKIVAQVSLRSFLGLDLCRNERWLDINANYAVTAIIAVNSLRKWPRSLVPIVHWFIPEVKQSRSLLDEARRILRPVYERKRSEIERARRDASPVPSQSDALGWFEELSDGAPYDPAVAQLTFAVAAVHSTTDFLCNLLVDLKNHPSLIVALREELVASLKVHGWKSSAFTQLRLMDSVMKESQRLKPISLVFMKSMSLHDIDIGNGSRIPKDAYLAVSAHLMRDSTVYRDPETFDGHRFLNPEHNAESRHFSSVSPEHMGFGFGKHACPGRFFVTLEIKILLAHILLKYDWDFEGLPTPAVRRSGFDQIIDPTARVRVRRRDEEIRLEDLLRASSI